MDKITTYTDTIPWAVLHSLWFCRFCKHNKRGDKVVHVCPSCKKEIAGVAQVEQKCLFGANGSTHLS